ncbi:MAG: hypothetical protein JWN70_1944 [Planctomycetaceae bacterium]|nr:hypothetical protein [Planctomycetaceae bacterium]
MMKTTFRSTWFLLLAAGLIVTTAASDQGLLARSDISPGGAISDDSVDAQAKLVRISGDIDGSGRIVCARDKLTYVHMHWGRPNRMMFDGEAWTNPDLTPPAWSDYSHRLDLTKAWIVKRVGRDTIALENTPDGFNLYLNDSPNGSQVYEVTIDIPRRR